MIVISSSTGLLMRQPEYLAYALDALGRVEKPDFANADASCGGHSPTAAWKAAHALKPGHQVTEFVIPSGAGDPYYVTLRPEAGVVPTRGITELWIDSACPGFVHVQDEATNNAGDILAFHFLDIHSGRILGLFGEAIVFFAGLFLTALPILGIWLWAWKRHIIRNQRRAENTPQSQASTVM